MYYLDQDSLPSVDELARYDLVVIDHEWAQRAPQSFFRALDEANPALRLLAYVNLVDYPDVLGSAEYWPGRYDLWQFSDSTSSSFPPQWLATTASGRRVSEWPKTSLANLTDVAPQVQGRIFAEYAAQWVVDRVWATGRWDGILLDVWGDRIYTADQDRWDIDGDGIDETDEQIYGPDGPWARGLARAEQLMRTQMPEAILVANSNRTLDRSPLNGRAWESFADPLAGRDPKADVQDYLTTVAAGEQQPPGVSMTIDRRRGGLESAEHYRRARFFLTATLLQDGYWAAMGEHYGELAFYDEMDGAGRGHGYLGEPVVEDPSWERVNRPYTGGVGTVAEGVYRRDFNQGVVLVNLGTEAQPVALGQTYRHLRGTQDPSVNTGELVDAVTIPPEDGLVLVLPER
ncbi:putative glycoside hydrolase family 15 protein (plasmid) [Rhodococcus pyridinivorans]|uniref:putative glycoside hydrolase n=1 Tax=Rhodococcus pyridinivorans TaxID=103816 RepID=UPI0020C6DC4D|nr:putative glycoside hydrolase [Rhodococcus pyridinivorans]UTM39893.1 putative glycoside hydrolase family 15 protein [Rhodococcus pyridinivorans]